MNTNLRDIIAPSFYEVHKFIKEDKYTHYWLAGGRASTKSSFISIEIPLLMMKDKNALKKRLNLVKEISLPMISRNTE